MTAAPAAAQPGDDVTANEDAWDAAVLAAGGHLLQSWRWGVFKEHSGWRVARFAAERRGHVALAQLLYRGKAGVTIGYVPRGPVVRGSAECLDSLWDQIDGWAWRQRMLTLIVEPNSALPDTVGRLVTGPEPIQPSRTVKTPLGDDDGLMAQMHAKTRYNVRMAMRRHVVCRIAQPSDEAVGMFYGLLQDTASRNAFAVHDEEYYRTFLHRFGQDALLMFAEVEGRIAAAVIAVVFGQEAIYMYGASSTRERANGAGFLIQYEAMRWARDRGAVWYDMWGIPDSDPQSTVSESGDRLARSHGGDWRGIYEFKTRFGGEIVRYPAPLERRYRPVLTTLARRFANVGGFG